MILDNSNSKKSKNSEKTTDKIFSSYIIKNDFCKNFEIQGFGVFRH